jgi:hypothetical protein
MRGGLFTRNSRLSWESQNAPQSIRPSVRNITVRVKEEVAGITFSTLERAGPGSFGSATGRLHASPSLMKFPAILIALVLPQFAIQAQTGSVDCSQRIAEDYVSTTRTERLADYVRSLAGPRAFLYAGALAGIDQAKNRPMEWRQGALGYERRFGNALARSVIANTLQHGLALGLDEDDRYFNSGQRGFGRRLGYAITSPLLARHSDKSRSLSISAIAGVAGASLITQIWQPRSTSRMGNAARSFGLTFAFRAAIDVWRELTPRVAGAIMR